MLGEGAMDTVGDGAVGPGWALLGGLLAAAFDTACLDADLGTRKSPSESGAGRMEGVPGPLPGPEAGPEGTTSGDALPDGLVGPIAGLAANGVDDCPPGTDWPLFRLTARTSIQSSEAKFANFSAWRRKRDPGRAQGSSVADGSAATCWFGDLVTGGGLAVATPWGDAALTVLDGMLPTTGDAALSPALPPAFPACRSGRRRRWAWSRGNVGSDTSLITQESGSIRHSCGGHSQGLASKASDGWDKAPSRAISKAMSTSSGICAREGRNWSHPIKYMFARKNAYAASSSSGRRSSHATWHTKPKFLGPIDWISLSSQRC
mmetsp:Transcript_42341/g.76833  ORF Transcript_42341/g.76833 Transcript_42341/m.76833 type:complete len:319 (+) Transcript_42341:852-1808(+)